MPEAIALAARAGRGQVEAALAGADPGRLRQAAWAVVLGRTARARCANLQERTEPIGAFEGKTLVDALDRLGGAADKPAQALGLAACMIAAGGHAPDDHRLRFGSVACSRKGEPILVRAALAAAGKPVGDGFGASQADLMVFGALDGEPGLGRRLAQCLEDPAVLQIAGLAARRSADEVRQRLGVLLLRGCWEWSPASRLASDMLGFMDGWDQGVRRAALATAIQFNEPCQHGGMPCARMGWEAAVSLAGEGVAILEAIDAAQRAGGKRDERKENAFVHGLAPLVPACLENMPEGGRDRVVALVRRLEGLAEPRVHDLLLAPLAMAMAKADLERPCRTGRVRRVA